MPIPKRIPISNGNTRQAKNAARPGIRSVSEGIIYEIEYQKNMKL